MKSKKVLTILLSLAIMVTFMPTFAFAASDKCTAGEYTWKVQPEKCGEYGVQEAKCVNKNSNTAALKVECEEVFVNAVQKAHDETNAFMNPKQYVEALMAQGFFGSDENAAAKAAAALADLNTRNYCELTVRVCNDCGKVLYRLGENNYRIARVGDNYRSTNIVKAYTTHKLVESCEATTTCEYCKKTLDNTAAATEAHKDYATDATNFTKATTAKVGGHTNLTKNVYTHKKCGQVVMTVFEGTNPDASAHNWGSVVPTETAKANPSKYIKIGENYYAPTVVVDGKACGEKGKGYVTCADCGIVYGTTTSSANTLDVNQMLNAEKYYAITCEADAVVSHDYQKSSVAATCTTPAISFEICSKCNATRNVVTEPVSSVSGHKYEVKELAKASCTNDGINVMKCSQCGNEILITDFDTNADYALAHAEEGVVYKSSDKKYYFVENGPKDVAGNSSKKYTEVPDWFKTNHKFGQFETMTEATCINGPAMAKKCSVCGMYDVHNAKETGKALGHDITTITVAPTCGSEGYTYSTCSRCKLFVSKDGKTTYEENQFETAKYDKVKPVVSEGTPCNFEWKVTKAATETTDGEKALVCTVCGTVKDGSQTVIPADVATAEKKAAVEAATPAVEAAADVIDNAAVYTAKSVKAIEEAKSMLNSAIASGSAADVKAMTENLQKVTAAAEKKAENGVTAKNKTVKASTKKNKTFKKAAKASNATGKVTFKKANKAGGSKIVVKSNGNVVVKKGLKKGTYKVKFTAKAAGNGTTLAGTSTGTVTVKVK